MKNICIAFAVVSFAALIHGSSYGASDDTNAEQQALPKYLGSMELSQLANDKALNSVRGRTLTPALPKMSSRSLQVKRSNPVYLGGASGPKKNIAVSGQINSPKNATAVGGNDTNRR
jgi:hypothetical protein